MNAGWRGVALGISAALEVMGAIGFIVAPERVFAEIGADPLARFCLRLAAFAHLGLASATLGLLWRADRHTARVLAAASALYHALAGASAAWALAGNEVVLTAPREGPLVFHLVMGLALCFVAVAPEASEVERR